MATDALPPGTRRLSSLGSFQAFRKREEAFKEQQIADKLAEKRGPTPSQIYRGHSPAAIHGKILLDCTLIEPFDLFLEEESSKLLESNYSIEGSSLETLLKLLQDLESRGAKNLLSTEERKSRKDLLKQLRQAATDGTPSSRQALQRRITTFLTDTVAKRYLKTPSVKDRMWRNFYK